LGGLRGLVHVRSILGNIGVLVLPDQQAIGSAYQAFDENGNLKDEAQQTSILQLGSKLATVTARLNLRSKRSRAFQRVKSLTRKFQQHWRTIMTQANMTQANMTQAKPPADPTPPTLEGKLALLRKLRDELGSGDTIRRLFFGDLEPIALQPGGAIPWFIFTTKPMMSRSPIAVLTMCFWLPVRDE
jgi:hypothetical protein